MPREEDLDPLLDNVEYAQRSANDVSPPERYESASFRQLLRYADRWDWLLLTIGTISSITLGGIYPIGSWNFRGITDVLMEGQAQYQNGTLDIDAFSHGIMTHVWIYVYIGIGTFTCGYLTHFFAAILNQDMEWFDHNEVGALTQKMDSGVERIRDGMSDKFASVLRAIAGMISGIIVGAYMSWQMTLVTLVTSPFLVISLYGSVKAISVAARREMDAQGSAGAVAEEVISGIRTVSAFNAQFWEVSRYKKQLGHVLRMGIRKAYITGFFAGLYLFVMFVSMGVAFWYGSTLVISGRMSPGTVFGVFWAVTVGAMGVGWALPQVGVIVAAKLAAGEIFSIIDRKPKLNSAAANGMRPSEVSGRIEFAGVNFRYPARPEVQVLQNVSFEVEPGQTVALVGHSGCGKSTMVGILMRYYQAEGGTITLDGIPIEALSTKWLRSIIGIVAQEPVLFSGTVQENLRMGREDATEEEMIDACKLAHAEEFIRKFPQGYNTVIGRGGVQLSGGQKQRIAIARALIRNPKILLLDEATSALDTESEKLVQEAIDEASSGRTTIVIAHRLSTIRNADKIIVFEHGQIVECGNHKELMLLNGAYRQLVAVQEVRHVVELENDVVVDDYVGTPMSPPTGSSAMRRARATSKESRSGRRKSDVSRCSMTSEEYGPAETNIYYVPPGVSATQDDCSIKEDEEELISEGGHKATLLEILRYSRPEMWLIVFGVLLSMLRGTAWPIFSIIYGRMFLALSQVDASGHAGHEAPGIAVHLLTSAAFVVLGVVSGLAAFGAGTLMGIVGEKMTMRLRLDVFKNILRQDGEFFDDPKHSTGKLTARLATDATNVQAAIDQRLADVLQGSVSLFTGVGVAFYFGWRMAPIGVATAVVLVVLQSAVSQYIKHRAHKDIEVAEEMSRIASEAIENVRTVQALTREAYLNKTFCESTKEPLRRAIVRGLWQSLSYALSTSFVGFNFAVAYTFGVFLIRGGYATPYTVFQVIEALNQASIAIAAAAGFFPEYLRARVAAGIMFTMKSKTPKVDSYSDAGMSPPIEGKVKFAHAHFAYPNAPQHSVINDFSMSAPFGQTIALVGPSGSGKSTVIQLLERYYDALTGSIMVDGIDIRNYNIRHLRAAMALVGQEPTLFNVSIRENIAYGMENVAEDEVEEAARLANIHDFVESLPQRYSTTVGGRGTQLSGGQKQRIAIARAMIRKPKILLLDEATSALDTKSEQVVQQALDRARVGRTCIVIAHRISTIQHADLIIVVRDGRVAELGRHQQLLAQKGLYYQLVQRQAA